MVHVHHAAPGDRGGGGATQVRYLEKQRRLRGKQHYFPATQTQRFIVVQHSVQVLHPSLKNEIVAHPKLDVDPGRLFERRYLGCCFLKVCSTSRCRAASTKKTLMAKMVNSM